MFISSLLFTDDHKWSELVKMEKQMKSNLTTI